MKLIRERRVDGQSNMLLIQNEQGTVQSITRVVIDPCSPLSIRRAAAWVCPLRERSSRAEKTLLQPGLSIQCRVQVRALEEAPQGGCEIARSMGGATDERTGEPGR